MTKTTNTTKKNKAVANDQNQAPAAQQTAGLPAANLKPEQARKDLAEIFAKATKMAPKAD